MKKKINSEPIYNKNILKTKIKSHGCEATDLQDKKMTNVGYNYTCLAVKLIDLVLKKDEYYYPKLFLKECK